MSRATRRADRVARPELGLERLRPFQREAVDAVMSGHDTLAALPTGAGKSAIYQVAGLLIPGPTIVVSPLLALQRHQVGGNAAVPAPVPAQLLRRTLRAAVRCLRHVRQRPLDDDR